MSKLLWLGLALSSVVNAVHAAEGPQKDAPPKEGAQGAPTAAEVSQLCRIDMKGDKKDQWIRLPKAESSVTQHHMMQGGKAIDYAATAGTLIVRDDEDKPIASFGYVAYVRQDKGPSRSTAAPVRPRCGCTWACSARAVWWCPIRIRRRRRRTAWSTTSTGCSTRATS